MSTRPYDVLIIGELNIDLLLGRDVTPVYGQVEQIIDDMALCAGSSSGIFASAASKMGLHVLFASRVGDDVFGHFLREELRRNGVDPAHVMVDPRVRTGATIVLARGHDRALLTFPGSMAELGPADVDPGWFELARHLHVASPFLLTRLRPALPKIMATAHQHGMTVSLDTNWDPDERWAVGDLLAQTDVLLPNEAELFALGGASDAQAALEALLLRVPLVAVKCGAEGALVATRDERIRVPAAPMAVVDATGAGDSFDGGFIAGWLRGQPLVQCARLAVACGSLSVRAAGGYAGQPTWEEAVALAAQLAGGEGED